MTIGLLLLSGLLALCYLWRGSVADEPGLPLSLAKTGATVLLAVIAILGGAPLAIILGLLLGAVGDFLLTRRSESAFVAGAAAFAAGHLAYAIWMFTPENALRMLWIVPLVVFAISAEAWLIPRGTSLEWPARGYLWIITAMAAAALSLPTQYWLILLGVALFLCSDLLLAIRMFKVEAQATKALLGRFLWAAYWAAQALITLGSMAATSN